MKKENIKVAGYRGTWYVIDECQMLGEKLYLLEHEELGDETYCICINKKGQLICDNIYNGFDDVRDVYEEKFFQLQCENIEMDWKDAEIEDEE